MERRIYHQRIRRRDAARIGNGSVLLILDDTTDNRDLKFVSSRVRPEAAAIVA